MRKNAFAYRIIAGLLIAVMFVFSMLPMQVLAGGESPEEAESQYEEKAQRFDIAMVFDNSGSMFSKDRMRWCYAKFAMEIFASMLNFESGDKLSIFPMWQVTTDGKRHQMDPGKDWWEYSETGSVEIKSIKDIDLISNMFTIFAGSTPFDPVERAAEYLKRGSADSEKWLIVLTDGVFNDGIDLNAKLSEMNLGNIKVQFLGIEQDVPANPGANVYVNRADGADIKDMLIDICNRIFERNELLDAENSVSFELPLSMKKLIVFVQGEDVKIDGLQAEGGGSVKKTSDSGPRKYSELDVDTLGNDYSNHKMDTSLFGQVCTFDACKTGRYTLQLSGSGAGSAKIQYFYTPDVRIEIVLIGEDGKPISDPNNVIPGQYKLQCALVDAQTGQDVSQNPLLGNDQDYSIRVTNNGNTKDDVHNGDTLPLEAGETKIEVKVSYLKKRYTVVNADSPFAKGFDVQLPKINDKLTLNGPGIAPVYYEWKKADEWKPIRWDVRLNGEKLTDAQMQAMQITFDVDDAYIKENVTFTHRLLPGESAFEIAPSPAKKQSENESNGSITDLSGEKKEDKSCKLTVKCSVKDAYDRDIPDDDTANLTFSKVSKYFWWFVILIVTATLILLILWFMSRKVLPRKIDKQSMEYRIGGKEIQGQNGVKYNRKGKKLTVYSAMPPKPEQECKITFSLYPVGRRWTPSRRRKFGVNGISGASMGVKSVTLNGITYNRDKTNHFVATGANPGDPIRDETIGAMVVINASRASLNAVLINK